MEAVIHCALVSCVSSVFLLFDNMLRICHNRNVGDYSGYV